MKFTDAQALQMARDHFEKGKTLAAIAEAYGTSRPTVQSCIDRKKVMDKYSEELTRRERKAEIRRRVAALKACEAAPFMMDQIIAIASQSVTDTDIKFQYAIHNAAADILNRAGIQAKQEENREIRVVLDSGIELGEPD